MAPGDVPRPHLRGRELRRSTRGRQPMHRRRADLEGCAKRGARGRRMAEPRKRGRARGLRATHCRWTLPRCWQREGRPSRRAGAGNVIVGIDGTPAVRAQLTGTEVYARSIIEALATSRGTRTMRVYANAVDAPGWLPAGLEWRGIPFPRLWTHWRLRQALRRERPDVTFIPSHVLPLALGLKSVVTIHDVVHRREPTSYSRAARPRL